MARKKAKNDRYYVHKYEGKVTRIAKICGSGGAYGWEDGKWVLMPGLRKIEWEITDFDDISKEEAERLIEAMHFDKS